MKKLGCILKKDIVNIKDGLNGMCNGAGLFDRIYTIDVNKVRALTLFFAIR